MTAGIAAKSLLYIYKKQKRETSNKQRLLVGRQRRRRKATFSSLFVRSFISVVARPLPARVTPR